MAVTKSGDLFHILSQNSLSFVNRDVECQLLPEAGHPP